MCEQNGKMGTNELNWTNEMYGLKIMKLSYSYQGRELYI